MITVVIRAMWDALRIIVLGIVMGLSFATWSVLTLAVITGRF